MANKSLPENIQFTSLNDTRKELDDKINTARKELDVKIDAKISTTLFCWVIGLLVIVCGGLISFLYMQFGSLKDNKMEGMQTRMTILETKFASHSDLFKNFQEDLQKQLTTLEKKLDSGQKSQPKFP